MSDDARIARLYYDHPALLEFEGVVVAHRTHDGRVQLALDRSAFYPTSGGQEHDTGTLEAEGRQPALTVSDVVDDEGTVWHVVDAPIGVGVRVSGAIDAARRFDHRQQHSGQHALSASCARVCGAVTRSVHLGADVCTLDLDREVTAADLDAAEAHANQVVFDDRPVQVRYVDANEAATLALRKATGREGTIRLVEIADHDLSACGGTHVSRTGEIGLIAVDGVERFRGGLRVSFVCGGRTLERHRAMRRTADAAARHLSVGRADIADAVARLQAEGREGRKAHETLLARLGVLEAALLASKFVPAGTCNLLVADVPDADAAALRRMASTLVSEPGRLVVLLGGPAPHSLVVARSADLQALDAGRIAREIAAVSGGKAGGRPDLAQGGGVTASLPEVTALVHRLQA